MRTCIRLSVVAGLSIAAIGSATADCEISTWRWHVTNILRAQQNRVGQPPPLSEGLPSAIEESNRFMVCSGGDFYESLLSPPNGRARR